MVHPYALAAVSFISIFGIALRVVVKLSFPSFLEGQHTPNISFVTESETPAQPENSSIRYRTILAWTAWNSQKVDFDRSPPAWFDHCPEPRCKMTSSRAAQSSADAVIFYIPDFEKDDLPPRRLRQANQYYIFFLMESPATSKILFGNRINAWDKRPYFFNLTMSYRKDSDIPFYAGGLGDYVPHHMHPTVFDNPVWFAAKRDILWFVSNCRAANRRSHYVKKLAKYVEVDQYGNCDGRPDPCKNRKCVETDILRHYKFYMAFENSLCNEYVTEKLARALNNDVVPIVCGGANYSSLLPRGSFINIEDFRNAQALARHLKYLARNETAYKAYLSWKFPGQPLWRIPGVLEKNESSWCRLCETLHQPVKPVPSQYEGIIDWWFQDQCREPYIRFRK